MLDEIEVCSQEEIQEQEKQRANFEELITTLQWVEHHLYPLLAPLSRANVAERIAREHTKAEIFEQIRHWKYRGKNVDLSWPKSELIDAYIAKERSRLTAQRASLLKDVCEILDWDYACMPTIPEEEKEGD